MQWCAFDIVINLMVLTAGATQMFAPTWICLFIILIDLGLLAGAFFRRPTLLLIWQVSISSTLFTRIFLNKIFGAKTSNTAL
jgi:hypothetical protein